MAKQIINLAKSNILGPGRFEPEYLVHYSGLLKKGRVWPEHEHDFWQTELAIDGAFEALTPAWSGKFGGGDVILIPPGMRHGFRYSEDSNIISARFKCPDCPPDLTRSVISLGGAAAEAFFAALRVLLDNGGAALERPDEKMMFESLLSAAFQIYRATVLGREKKISPAVERAERVIAGAPGVRVTVAGAAKKAACSAGYLSSLFRKERGVSLKKYIAAKKMELAAKYLLYSDMTVTETAARLGFPDIYEFSRFVKRQTGKSPAQLRREEASRFAHSKKAE